MGEFGLKYSRMKFSYLIGIEPEQIVRETVLDDTEIIYEINDGRKILYDEIDDRLISVGYTNIDHITDSMWKKEFSRRLRKNIAIKGLYKKEFAELIGVSENTMSNYITGKTIPTAYIIQRMADTLGCEVSYLTDFNYLLGK